MGRDVINRLLEPLRSVNDDKKPGLDLPSFQDLTNSNKGPLKESVPSNKYIFLTPKLDGLCTYDVEEFCIVCEFFHFMKNNFNFGLN